MPNECLKDINLWPNKRISSSAPEIAANQIQQTHTTRDWESAYFCHVFVFLSFSFSLSLSPCHRKCALIFKCNFRKCGNWFLAQQTEHNENGIFQLNFFLYSFVVFFSLLMAAFLAKMWNRSPHFSIWMLSSDFLRLNYLRCHEWQQNRKKSFNCSTEYLFKWHKRRLCYVFLESGKPFHRCLPSDDCLSECTQSMFDDFRWCSHFS